MVETPNFPDKIKIIGLDDFFAAYKIYKASDSAANDYEFRQAGVRVVFSTGKITIGKHTYDVTDVQALESERFRMGNVITIKVDDFKKPLHKVSIDGFGRESGESLSKDFLRLYGKLEVLHFTSFSLEFLGLILKAVSI